MTSSRIEVDALVRLLDQAFAIDDGRFGPDDWHTLIGNLDSVSADQWDWAPPLGARTIRELVTHVGACYLMYENHAFGDRSRSWGDKTIVRNGRRLVPEDGVEWLRATHEAFRSSVARLDDAQLDEKTCAPWGAEIQVRRVIEIMLQHGIYHAGEINHIRALAQGNDAWEYEP